MTGARVRVVARTSVGDLSQRPRAGRRFFVMSVGSAEQRTAAGRHGQAAGLQPYIMAFSDEPQVIEARSEASARAQMKRNGWGNEHFECLGVGDTAEEAEGIHDDHWPPA